MTHHDRSTGKAKVICCALTPIVLTPSVTAGAVRLFVSPFARAMRDVTFGRTSGTGWQELVNKTDIIDAVEGVGGRSDAFFRLWILEGEGRRLMDRLIREHRPGAFSRSIPNHLSNGARAMLHAGMGMALAITFLSGVPGCAGPAGVQRRLHDFVLACRSYSQRGYAAAALESLGLVTRFLRPDLVGVVDRILCNGEADLVAYFWHGAGRGIYFLPVNMAQPITGDRGDLLSVRNEPPHAIGQANALAGWAWAAALVNLHHPPVIDAAFRNCQPDEAAVLAYGVWSAVSIRLAVDRTDQSIASLLRYLPQPSNRPFAKFWDAAVRRPAARALRTRVDDLEQLYRIDRPKARQARCA
jgi:hypothetical protein